MAKGRPKKIADAHHVIESIDKEPQELDVGDLFSSFTDVSWGSLYMDYERLIASHSLFHVAIGEQLISPNKEPQRLCPLLRLVAMKQTVSDSRLKTLVMDERSEGNVGGYRKCFRTLVLGLWPEAFSTPTFTSFIHPRTSFVILLPCPRTTYNKQSADRPPAEGS